MTDYQKTLQIIHSMPKNKQAHYKFTSDDDYLYITNFVGTITYYRCNEKLANVELFDDLVFAQKGE